jgi:2-methylcitrate dehydratase PrpD
VLAATLAARGLSADKNIFDVPMGFALFCDRGDWDGDALIQGLGRPWAILDPGLHVKIYPCCGGTHRAVDAALVLGRELGSTIHDIERIDIWVPNRSTSLIEWLPKTGLEGKFSMEYCVSCALSDGKVVIRSFTDEAVLRPDIRSLMAKIHIHEQWANEVDVAVEATLGGGRKLRHAVLHPKGSPARPASWSDVEEKFRHCSAGKIPDRIAERAIRSVQTLQEAPRVKFNWA